MRKKKVQFAPVGEANVLPVMNVMFLLIPALLLAMETASMAAISVNAPKICNTGPANNEPVEPTVDLKIRVASDGFWLTTDRQHVGKQGMPTIARDVEGDYDYALLEARARELKAQYPASDTVHVTAESDVPMQTLVRTMDALRGSDCKLSGMGPGEEAPTECLFWHPVVESL